MSMFTLGTSYLTTSNLPWFMDLIFQVPMQYCSSQHWTLLWPPDTTKECSNYYTIALISHVSKIMLKILQARLQQYVNHELPDFQAGFRKGRGARRARDQTANIRWIIEKAREFQKNICFIDYAKAFDCVDKTNYGIFLMRLEYQTTLPASWEICMQDKKQHLEFDMEQQTVLKSGKEYVKAVNCHPAYLTYMQSISYEMLGWMNHKPESRLPGGISTTSYMQIIPL